MKTNCQFLPLAFKHKVNIGHLILHAIKFHPIKKLRYCISPVDVAILANYFNRQFAAIPFHLEKICEENLVLVVIGTQILNMVKNQRWDPWKSKISLLRRVNEKGWRGVRAF